MHNKKLESIRIINKNYIFLLLFLKNKYQNENFKNKYYTNP